MDIIQKALELVGDFGRDPAEHMAMMELFPVGMVITDLEGRIVFYNLAQAKTDSLDKAEVIGQERTRILAPVGGPDLMDICQKTGQPILGYISPYRTFKGRLVDTTSWVFPTFREGRVSGCVGFFLPLSSEFAGGRRNVQPIKWPGVEPEGPGQDLIVGGSPAFQKCLLMIRSNASNPFPIMISGETGSGKEMLAKLVHRSSPRNDKPYLALNCSAVPGTLLEGLLFGTVKGSFTGAIDRPGLLEEVNGGTLYLDEIDSMPLELQPKLLRAIQDMRISRVGSATEIDLDIKLISSISSSPQKALGSGALRADLFYRLAVVVVNIPPLRKRMEDLEYLVEHFLQKYSGILNRGECRLDRRLWKLIYDYHWPGNVRELEHMLAGAMAMVREDGVIGLEQIPEHYIQAFASGRQPRKSEPPDSKRRSVHRGQEDRERASASRALADWPQTNDPVEKLRREVKEIRACLAAAGGNISRAAEMMGMSRQSLSYRLMKHNLDHRDFKSRK